MIPFIPRPDSETLAGIYFTALVTLMRQQQITTVHVSKEDYWKAGLLGPQAIHYVCEDVETGYSITLTENAGAHTS